MFCPRRFVVTGRRLVVIDRLNPCCRLIGDTKGAIAPCIHQKSGVKLRTREREQSLAPETAGAETRRRKDCRYTSCLLV